MLLKRLHLLTSQSNLQICYKDVSDTTPHAEVSEEEAVTVFWWRQKHFLHNVSLDLGANSKKEKNEISYPNPIDTTTMALGLCRFLPFLIGNAIKVGQSAGPNVKRSSIISSFTLPISSAINQSIKCRNRIKTSKTITNRQPLPPSTSFLSQHEEILRSSLESEAISACGMIFMARTSGARYIANILQSFEISENNFIKSSFFFLALVFRLRFIINLIFYESETLSALNFYFVRLLSTWNPQNTHFGLWIGGKMPGDGRWRNLWVAGAIIETIYWHNFIRYRLTRFNPQTAFCGSGFQKFFSRCFDSVLESALKCLKAFFVISDEHQKQ